MSSGGEDLETMGLKKGPLEEEAQERECKLTNADQKEKELE